MTLIETRTCREALKEIVERMKQTDVVSRRIDDRVVTPYVINLTHEERAHIKDLTLEEQDAET